MENFSSAADYGSYEFYAINTETGAVVWQIKTSDDGPTAAVVEDDCVAFNTESCTVIVCDARTGKVLDGSLRASLRRGRLDFDDIQSAESSF